MKFNGEELKIREVTSVTLPRTTGDVTLQVTSIPLGIRRAYEVIFPKPRPPFTTTSYVGKPSEKEADYDDPVFVKAFNEWSYLQNIYTFYVVLQGDKKLVFDNTVTDADTLRKLEAELRDAGITEGDVGIVLLAAAEASNITSRELDAAKKDF